MMAQPAQSRRPLVRHLCCILNGGVAIADMDKDGFGEIVMASSAGNNAPNEQRRLICYEYDGSTYTQKWISDQPYGYTNDHEGWTPL
jgi:hypothetical protein